MSKGSPIITVRLPQQTIDRVNNEIARINARRMDSPYTLRTFIVAAVFDKLAHIDRSRSKHSSREQRLEAGLSIAEVTLTIAEHPFADPTLSPDDEGSHS